MMNIFLENNQMVCISVARVSYMQYGYYAEILWANSPALVTALSWTGIQTRTGIRLTAVPIEGPREISSTSQQYRIKGFEGALN